MIQRREEVLQTSENDWLSLTRDKNSQAPKATIILCHGLTGDKIGPQKLLSDLSRYLAINCNVEIIRFDFHGSGLSSGDFAQTHLISMQRDALQIANHIHAPILWMGISTGAIVALMAAAKRGKKEKVIAISNGFSELIDFTHLEQDPVPLREGQLWLFKEFFSQRSLLRPRKNYFSTVGAITVILGTKDEKHFIECQSLQDLGNEVITIEEGDHLFTNPKRRKQLFLYVEEKVREST